MNMINKKLIIAFFSVLILGIIGLFTIDQATQSRINNLSVISEVPSFQLDNFDGTSFTEKNLDNKINNILGGLDFLAPWLIRLGLGIAFIIHGYNKFPLPPQGLINYFGFSPALATFVALSEVFAGIIIIVGVSPFRSYISTASFNNILRWNHYNVR